MGLVPGLVGFQVLSHSEAAICCWARPCILWSSSRTACHPQLARPFQTTLHFFYLAPWPFSPSVLWQTPTLSLNGNIISPEHSPQNFCRPHGVPSIFPGCFLYTDLWNFKNLSYYFPSRLTQLRVIKSLILFLSNSLAPRLLCSWAKGTSSKYTHTSSLCAHLEHCTLQAVLE